MRTGIYAGSFDPLTHGHLDVIRRAARLFDHLIIAVARNPSKTALFTPEEKLEQIKAASRDLEHVTCEYFDGLLVEYAVNRGAVALVRGIRTVSDFEYEFPMTLTNRQLEPLLETVFLMTDNAYAHLSSSLIKEIARMGGDISEMVPAPVLAALKTKFSN